MVKKGVLATQKVESPKVYLVKHGLPDTFYSLKYWNVYKSGFLEYFDNLLKGGTLILLIIRNIEIGKVKPLITY